jgi:hypothetical protein
MTTELRAHGYEKDSQGNNLFAFVGFTMANYKKHSCSFRHICRSSYDKSRTAHSEFNNSPMLWRRALSCPLKFNRRYNRTLLATCFTLVSRLDYSSTLKMEAICFSETSVVSQRSIRRYITGDRTLHNNRCQILKYYRVKYILL